MTKTIYYLPGHGGRFTTGLGLELSSRGYVLVGRETVGEFRRLSFSEQVDLVTQDIMSGFWHENAKVIANSYGAYLFLHAQALMEPYVGRVLLLSPIIGEFVNNESTLGFIPPMADRLSLLAKAGSYPTPLQCEIHVGANDWQSDQRSVSEWAGMLGINVNIVPDSGHRIDKNYVAALLNSWLSKD